jgi:hypothetical protein
MDYKEYRNELLRAIEQSAKCDAAYFQTQPVRYGIDGAILWKGKVEIFQLKNHPQAKVAFGWGYEGKNKKIEYVTIVGVPPLDTPLQAVKAFVASIRR